MVSCDICGAEDGTGLREVSVHYRCPDCRRAIYIAKNYYAPKKQPRATKQREASDAPALTGESTEMEGWLVQLIKTARERGLLDEKVQ